MIVPLEVNGRRIGPGYPVYAVAELSANHHQDFDMAVELIKVSRKVGADAVKLQTYTPDTLTLRHDSDLFQIKGQGPWTGRTLYDLYSEAYMPWEWHPKLKQVAAEVGIDLFSTPFDLSAVDFLESMGVPLHKIASFEIVDIPLIKKIARTGKPIIISTGMATLGEIENAVVCARAEGATQVALLKCASAYPASPDEMNLRALPHLAEAFQVPVGLSDHTLGIAVPVAAVALGACIIEKHLTLSRDRPGPDSAFSLEPQEFRAMVEAIRSAERALGEVRYGPSEREQANRGFRRSLFVVEDIKTGDTFTERNVRSIRPGHGLEPKYLPDVLGKTAARDISRGTPLSWELIALS